MERTQVLVATTALTVLALHTGFGRRKARTQLGSRFKSGRDSEQLL
ncbi:hypothetical protein QM996_27565 (plasmid) [Sinorhizobium chiapasense]